MQIKNTTVHFILDKRRLKTDKTYPLKMRVTYRRKPKWTSLNASMTEEEYGYTFQSSSPTESFKKQLTRTRKRELEDIKLKVDRLRLKVYDIIQEMPFFSFEEFEFKIRKTKNHKKSVYDVFQEELDRLNKEGRIATAQSYKAGLRSLQSLQSDLQFHEVTPRFLKTFEHMRLQQGKSLTTVGTNMRALRVILNIAIDEGLMSKDRYPFGRRKYQIPAGRRRKKALPIDDIKRIAQYEVEKGSPNEFAQDIFIFSFLCGGMNMKDIAHLKQSNIRSGYLHYLREKTKLSSRTNSEETSVYLCKKSLEILERYTGQHDDFLFPIRIEGQTLLQAQRSVKYATKAVNKYIAEIATAVGIEEKVTTYTARHSCATYLNQSGIGLREISQMLSHQNTTTTEIYIHSIDGEKKERISNLLHSAIS